MQVNQNIIRQFSIKPQKQTSPDNPFKLFTLTVQQISLLYPSQ